MSNTKFDDGGLAFSGGLYEHGMSLRDWFAGQSLANLYTHSEQSPDKAAEWAYQVADAMIAARKGAVK